MGAGGAPTWVDFNGSSNSSSRAQPRTEEPVWEDLREEPPAGIDMMLANCCLWACIFPGAQGTVLVTLTGHFTRNGKPLVENVIGVSRPRQQVAIPPLALPLVQL